MRTGFCIVFCLLVSFLTKAQQPFGNEWINSTQSYVKISIVQTGIYRVGYSDIRVADATLTQTNPINWQLFHRGREVAMRVVGQTDGRFDAGDYIEFYATGHDGASDSLLYRPQKRLHPYQTLFSDTTACFLTYNPGQPGRRVVERNDAAIGLAPEPFHVETVVRAFTSDYSFNNLKSIEPFLQQSFYEPGEGWTGPIIKNDSVGIVTLPFVNRVRAAWPITLSGMVNGRDNADHEISVQTDAALEKPIAELQSYGFLSESFEGVVKPESIQREQLSVRLQAQKTAATNNFSLAYLTLTYPQTTDMGGQSAKLFRLPPGSRQTALLSVANPVPNAVAYDISDPYACRWLVVQPTDNRAQVVVGQAGLGRSVLLTNQFQKPAALRSVRFRNSFPVSANYLIITHASLRSSAVAYAAYRSSASGGGHVPFVVEADSLYDQFNYGERSPLALRQFANFMLSRSSINNLLLIGRANSYPYTTKTSPDNLVPTIGYPGSDVLLTAGLRGYPINTPAIPTGRITATANEQVLNYLRKVQQFETNTPNDLWRKQIVHVSGGKNPGEIQSLKADLGGLADLFTTSLLGGSVNVFYKTTTAEVEKINIAPLVNDGVGLITFFGHAGPSVTDVNFGFASPPENGFRNSRYPLMIFNGCGVGEIFSRFNTLSTDWLLAPDKGAVSVLAHSYWSYQYPTTRYLTKLYGYLFDNPATLGASIGQVQQQVNQAVERESTDPFDVSVITQMVLQGDPAVRLFPLSSPDFAVDAKQLFLKSLVAGRSLGSSDSLRLVVPLANAGRFVPGQSMRISIVKVGATTTTQLIQQAGFRYRDTLVYTLPKDEKLQRIDVIIDPDNQLTELTKANNRATLQIDWAKAQYSSSYPPTPCPTVWHLS
ncbi:C25 family cysteine peptidase [Spirosoma montaniterrae]|uniref:putative type IX secretion system sortase PorU2 n=1 Tax=Spirosoma montaniterrae TaxID=1178516 RepID=UPI001E47DFF7|nr:C25 family cysteine peptidase [Spirosoma montaniterrae]